ncbi:1,4-alpha-glucan branching enzyme GlgB [Candidatus Protochlamydia naegleriophila]|uniref:1,4-alpha-glucan branching enzyme GlgB n=1 Tax=Candidatus Protochlamydia naegleriophila TaxID=389348 RepID=A0A0U5JCC9_9BACT|nr:1,4-alpha-glucan branching protein GlgB [Candidatus Protochlamydia naegleriophila]CUI16490.1 1,4-alpha-glucan branching enzyme GlgB [Candidatus Protochlamydia naegleriophila]
MMTMQPTEFEPHFYDNLLRIIQMIHHQPHTILGLHPFFGGSKVIHLWRPGAQQVFIEVFGDLIEAKRIHEEGIFECVVPGHTTALDYRVFHQNGLLAYDPYAFLPTFGEMDQYLFGKGVHYELYECMGGRLTTHGGVSGVKFSVWAPNAKSVSLVADFNYWDGRVNPMRVMGYSGIWELFVPGIGEGEKYKFEIHTQQGERILKSDPFAYSCELRPATASVIANIERFKWQDQAWIEKRTSANLTSAPMNVYEVHLGSWRKRGNDFLNYRELAHELVAYCLDMGFTHVELLPIQEHPLDESWGYQVSGFYAPTSRFGTPEDFQYFVNYFHNHQLGVILDWVPGHFPMDAFSIGRFDGSALYEHADPRQGYHPHWHTHIFNFGRHEVSNFLIANALYWFEVMHIDGLRVDAVASMLYLDYGREESEWIPNDFGGKENLQAIEFIKHLNSIVHSRCPGVLTIAEESTSFPGVTHSVESGGLGFDFKWNMGWMNDTLRYFSKDTLFRSHHHHDLTFGLIYVFSEKFISVLSHDEVVHGKRSLLSKMPGDMWQQFANLRLLLSYMICQPGKKLLFMGAEIGQWNEWNCKSDLEWFLLQFPTHQGIQNFVRDINHFYLNHPAFWQKDCTHESFEWVDFADIQNSVISYLRKSSEEKLLCVHNYTPLYHSDYVLHLSQFQNIEEIFNSDDQKYGGSGKHTHPEVIKDAAGKVIGVRLALAPLATMIFKLV